MGNMGVNIKSFSDRARRMNELMQLDGAPYIKDAKESFDPDLAVGLEMTEGGVTNPKSEYPLLATTSVATCMAVFVHNPKTDATGLVHIVENGVSSFPDNPSVNSLVEIIDQVSKPKSDVGYLRNMWSRNDKLEARIVGPNVGGDLSNPFINNVLDILSQYNISILSADFKSKAGPRNIAVDSSRWGDGLIRGTVDSVDFFRDNDIKKAELYIKQTREVVDLDNLGCPADYSSGHLAFNGLVEQHNRKQEYTGLDNNEP